MSGTSLLLGLPQPLRVVVIGAGQAGLAAAYFLRARGLKVGSDFVVLDGPGPDGSQAPSQGEADPIMGGGGTSAVRQLPVHGCRNEPSRWETPIDAILWATGFRHDHGHLAPLKLRRRGGGILLDADDVTALEMPGLYFTGYGASASTFGATRAGRRAALKAVRYVEAAS